MLTIVRDVLVNDVKNNSFTLETTIQTIFVITIILFCFLL